jgi:hypothetical protein
MKRIPLNNGMHALVDDCDFRRVGKYKWYYHHSGYAARMENVNGERRFVTMHRQVMGEPEGLLVEHRDKTNRLDNRRANLRVCGKMERTRFRGKIGECEYKGVSKARNGYAAYISHMGKVICCGHYPTAIEAARAYDAYAVHLFGELACLNFPDERTWTLEQARASTSRRQQGYWGVSFHRLSGKYQVNVRVDGSNKYLGLFPNEEQAARVHDAAVRLYGKNTNKLNFPESAAMTLEEAERLIPCGKGA